LKKVRGRKPNLELIMLLLKATITVFNANPTMDGSMSFYFAIHGAMNDNYYFMTAYR